MGHIQTDIPNKDVEGGEIIVPITLYTVPDRFKIKITEFTLTNPDVADAEILIEDVDGANRMEKLDVIVPAGETLTICGIMRHFAKSIVASNLTNATTVAISASGYLC